MPLKRYLKFSLRTLLLATLCAASGMLLYQNWGPWQLNRILEAFPGANSDLSLQFFQDDHFVAATGRNRYSMWDAQTGKLIHSGYDSIVPTIASSSPTSPLFILRPKADNSRQYIFSMIRQGYLFQLDKGVQFVFQSKDGSVVSARYQDRVDVWDCVTRKKLWTLPGAAFLIALSDDGKWMAEVHEKSGHVRLFEARTGALKKSWQNTSTGRPMLSFSPNGELLFSSFSSEQGQYQYVWSVKDGKLLSHWKEVDRVNNAFSFSPDSRKMLSEGPFQSVRITDVATGKLIREGSIITGSQFYSLQYFPDGERIFSSQQPSYQTVVDATTLRILYSFPQSWKGYALSAKGDRVASVSYAGDVRLWKRIRPEYWWGPAYLPEFWLTAALAALLLWSLIKDLRANKFPTNH